MNFWVPYGIVVSILFVAHIVRTRHDRGHACYEARDERAAVALVRVFALGGLTELFTTDSGPAHQCMLSDRKTVLVWLEAAAKDRGTIGNVRSLVVADPRIAAAQAATILREAGCTAEVRDSTPQEPSSQRVFVYSDACVNHCLSFRKFAGRPPRNLQRRILRC